MSVVTCGYSDTINAPVRTQGLAEKFRPLHGTETELPILDGTLLWQCSASPATWASENSGDRDGVGAFPNANHVVGEMVEIASS